MMHVIQKWNSCDAGRQLCVTHAGVFHADEVLATAILERAFGNIEVLRVIAVPDCLPENAIIYDLGGGLFDHHQRDGNGCRANGIPYASSGLVWRIYGKQALDALSDAERIQSFVDDALVSRVDASDNGFAARFDGRAQSPLTVTEAISGFNPVDGDRESYDTAFLKAVKWMRAILDNSIRSAIASVSAEAEVNRAIGNAVNGLLILDRYQPWKKVLADSENPKTDGLIAVIYPSVRGVSTGRSPAEIKRVHLRTSLPRRVGGARKAKSCNMNAALMMRSFAIGLALLAARKRKQVLYEWLSSWFAGSLNP